MKEGNLIVRFRSKDLKISSILLLNQAGMHIFPPSSFTDTEFFSNVFYFHHIFQSWIYSRIFNFLDIHYRHFVVSNNRNERERGREREERERERDLKGTNGRGKRRQEKAR